VTNLTSSHQICPGIKAVKISMFVVAVIGVVNWLCNLCCVKDSSVLYECEVDGPPQTLCLYGGNGGV